MSPHIREDYANYASYAEKLINNSLQNTLLSKIALKKWYIADIMVIWSGIEFMKYINSTTNWLSH